MQLLVYGTNPAAMQSSSYTNFETCFIVSDNNITQELLGTAFAFTGAVPTLLTNIRIAGEVQTLLTNIRNKDQTYILGEEQQGHLDSLVFMPTNDHFHTQPTTDEYIDIHANKDIMSTVKPRPKNTQNFIHNTSLLVNHQHTSCNTFFTSTTNCT